MKKTITAVLVWIVSVAISVSPVSVCTALAQDSDVSTAVEMQDEETTAVTTVEISDTTEESLALLVSTINNAADGDAVEIQLTAEPAEGETEVVYSLSEDLLIVSGADVTITGNSGVTYRLEAVNSDAISGSLNSSYPAFLNVAGELSLWNVTIDANEMGRAVYISGGELNLVENAVAENGYTTSQGAGIYIANSGSLSMGDGCFVCSCVASGSGAGVYVYNGTMVMESGSSVYDNQVISTGAAYGGGIYGAKNSTLQMESGSSVENNSITANGIARGAGIYNAGSLNMAGEVSGNSITQNSETGGQCQGAGIYEYAAATFERKISGTVSDNTITGKCGSSVYGAGIYIRYRNAYLVDATITGNTIDLESVTGEACGAGVYLYCGAYIGGDIQIQENTVDDSASNVYMYMPSAEYPLTVVKALSDDAQIGLYAPLSSTESEILAIQGYESEDDTAVTLSSSDVFKFTYEPQGEEDADYTFVYNTSDSNIYLSNSVSYSGGTVEVTNEEELTAALAAASTDEDDITTIILKNDITVSGELSLAQKRHVTLTSAEGSTYSIIAGEVLDSSTTGTLLSNGGNLTLTNVTLNANGNGRVIQAYSGSDLVIGSGATVTGGYATSGSQIYGAGILVNSGGKVTLADGGSITGNNAADADADSNASQVYGLGVSVKSGGTFEMTGGTLSNNVDLSQNKNIGTYTGTAGGGIYSFGTVIISGGTISGNVTGTSGGAIYAGSNSTVEISGDAEISGNTAGALSTNGTSLISGSGGAIYISGGEVTLSGSDVVIKENDSMMGGGIYVTSAGTTEVTTGVLNIEGAQIINNLAHISSYAAGAGGGIFMNNGATVNMSSGTISGNTVAVDSDVTDVSSITQDETLLIDGYGGGIFVGGAGSTQNMQSTAAGTPVLNLSGGTITDNDAYNGGSGIYVANYTVGGSTSANDGSGYNFIGSGILNVSGSPVVTGNEDDDILLAASRYIDDDADWNVEYTIQTSTQTREGTGLRKNVIYPVYMHIVEALDESADLHVSKELLAYDAGTVYVADERQTVDAYDNIIVDASGDYEITEDNLDSILDVVDIDILTDGFWQLSATTVDTDDSDETSESDSTDAGSEDTSSALTAIEGISLDVTTALADDMALTYTGSELTPEIVVTATAEDESSAVLTEGTDYEIAYEDNVDAGTATYTITGTGRYQGTVTGEFTIEGKSLTDEDVTVTLESELCLIDPDSDETQAQEPAVTVIANGTTLTGGEDYTLTYEDNEAFGTATVTVTGAGSYTDTVTMTFKIRYSGSCVVEETDEDGSTSLCYETDGVVNTDYTGLVESGGTTWYVVDGTVASDYSGLVTDGENTYYVTDGIVNAGAETAEIDGLLYDVTDGQATLYTGLYDGLYYRDGVIYTGTVTVDGIIYTVVDGVMTVHADTLVARRNGNVYYFSSSITDPDADVTMVTYGRQNDEVLIGDWDGDGVDTLAVRRNGNTYYFSNSVSDPNADVIVVTFGRAGDEVLVGDWNGDGIDTLAVRRNGNTYYFSNSITDPNAAVIQTTYGRAVDEVYVGDWDGDGIDTLAVRRDGNVYYFSNSVSDPNAAVIQTTYGRTVDEVLVGDWNGDGIDTLAVRRNGNVYYFSNSVSDPDADVLQTTYGRAADEVYAGKWN
ncbi:MAG: hypothetical protein LUG27_01245 [Clostridiales bacterium]|nr:hypothetical protein [Clostridiales bacterium]